MCVCVCVCVCMCVRPGESGGVRGSSRPIAFRLSLSSSHTATNPGNLTPAIERERERMCVCVRERERERERMCVCVCV